MTKAELLELLQDLDDNAELTVIDDEQNYCWHITEVRVCEDNASEYKGKYADIVIDIDTDKSKVKEVTNNGTNKTRLGTRQRQVYRHKRNVT